MTNTSKSSLSNVRGSSSNLADDARDTIDDVKGDLQDVANRAGRKVRSFFDRATDEFNHTTEIVTDEIRDKPVQSALIALGAGFILGALFRR